MVLVDLAGMVCRVESGSGRMAEQVDVLDFLEYRALPGFLDDQGFLAFLEDRLVLLSSTIGSFRRPDVPSCWSAL